ncbi:copper chaperone PCu(A)C [Dietzia sp. PP-33]|jgi:copper(I)-binding protein|uniref:copper chaperone PCu(A)C n=1 Tax=Dietzia sp. PP-33 TaxID=2957500 RepID=UPI0029BAC2E1|nr:copper chaperone PCu(A)C [Dietzia sp. PP-33]MDX2356270.1 copper chaperone PCu(A)C [Dietzia sp. PP-33]
MRSHTRAALAAATALTLALATTACSTDESTGSAGASDETTSVETAAETTTVVTVEDGWAKATDSGMTGVFGTISNPGETDVHLTGVSDELAARAELHETVPGGGGMMMQEKEDGFVIPAGGELILEPGGNHIMLMDLDLPITTGQQITLTLEFSGGAEQDVTVSARDFSGGEEEYVGGDHGGDVGGDAGMNNGGTGGMSHDG